MTAQTSRQSLRFELPNMLSYHATWDDADYEPQLPAPRRSVPAHLLFFAGTRLAAFVGARVQAARARRMAASEMVALPDRGIRRHGHHAVRRDSRARSGVCA